MFKECILVQINLQHLGCWNHLEKLVEMFLNTFHREHILLEIEDKKVIAKNEVLKLNHVNSWSFF